MSGVADGGVANADEPPAVRPAEPERAGQRWSIRLLSVMIATVMLAGVIAAASEGERDEEETGARVPVTLAPGPGLSPSGPVDAATTTVTEAAPAPTGPAAPVPPPVADTVPATATPAPDAAAPAAPPSWLQPDPLAGQAAPRMIMWTGCPEVVALTDQQLDGWRDRGVGGFVCMVRWLRPFGGTQDFTGDANNRLEGANYDLQRSIRESGIVQRAEARGLKLYLGFYLVNFNNAQTPLAEWFDDGAWSATVLPALRDVAGAANLLGFAGLAFDQELYPQRAGQAATWSWDYPGRTRSEGDVRAKARQRGAEMMTAIAGSFPDVEILDYASYFPESWNALVQLEVNDVQDAYEESLQVDVLDGLTSVEGYRAIRFMEATFYKTPHLSGATWDTALQYDYNRVYSLLSRRLSNWAYASTRIFRSPFVWISEGETEFERARPPDYVAAQLDAARRWGLGGEFANYAYGRLDRFDYGPYEAGMRAAAQPGVVDEQPPTLNVSGASVQNGTATVQGNATDNMAIRAIGWSTSGGQIGTAPMTWQVLGGDYRSGYDWQMDWAATVPLAPGPNRVIVAVQDAKGLVTTQELTLEG